MSVILRRLTDIFEYGVLSCFRCDTGFISSPLHKCWIAVCRSNCFCLWPLSCFFFFYVHSCHIKAAALGWGECRGALKIFSWRVCVKAELPLGSLPPALLIIVPFHPMPWLNPWETSGPLSHTWLLWLYPPPPHRFASPRAANKPGALCECVCTWCMHKRTSFFFFFFFFFLEAN